MMCIYGELSRTSVLQFSEQQHVVLDWSFRAFLGDLGDQLPS